MKKGVTTSCKLLLCFAVTCAASAKADTAVTEVLSPAIDHIMIEHESPEKLYKLLSDQLQFPTVWPLKDYGSFASAGVHAGNVVLELGRFSTHAGSSAQLVGVALKPAQALEGVEAGLDLRKLNHGQITPFTVPYGGKPYKMWSHLPLAQWNQAQEMTIFFCEYHMNLEPAIKAAASSLESKQGGPLGIVGVKTLTEESPKPEQDEKNWAKLTNDKTGEGISHFTSGPQVKIVSGTTSRLLGLRLLVRNLTVATHALEEKGWSYTRQGNAVRISPENILGLNIELVDDVGA